MKFKEKDRVIVVRVKSSNDERDYSTSRYPRIGWTGTISRSYPEFSDDDKNIEYVILWDSSCLNMISGDLVREWMIDFERANPNCKSIRI
ncbi:hypothetical protein LCGC14_1476930 [marine sediment metagenome]|uniref:Uncharacterized protein n=1 Tax=marine sediment metagenome TaxID=412755 RepID=A0A0F9JBE7_9ZZZZ